MDDVTISEGEEKDVCFSVGETARPYQVIVGVRGKGNQMAGNSFHKLRVIT